MTDLIHLLPRLDGMKVIVIDGRSGSGKTTLSSMLAKELNASVVHMDDFFLPLSLRSEERLSEPGGNVHYERFMEDVLPFIRSGKPFSYRPFDCTSMDYSDDQAVIDKSVVIVEGAYSLHPLFGHYYDFSIFLDIDEENQIRRIEERSGKEKAEVFRSRWIPLEEQYIKAFSIMEKADLILSGDVVSL